MSDVADRFWAKVDMRGPDECWPWTGAIGSRGYGNAWFMGQNMNASRAAFILENGEPPKEKPFVLHNCEGRYQPGDFTYRRCVNPAHLRCGTAKENTGDALGSGRFAAGDRHPLRKNPGRAARGEGKPDAKLTDESVLAIRAIWARGFGTLWEIAEMHGISKENVFQVVHRKTWRHLPPAAPDPRDCR